MKKVIPRLSYACGWMIFLCLSGCITKGGEHKESEGLLFASPSSTSQTAAGGGLLFGSSLAVEDPAHPGRRLDAPVVDVSEVKDDAHGDTAAQDDHDGGLLFGEREAAIWPLAKGRVTSTFGWRRKRHFHAGIDIVAPRGSSVLAALGGTVIFAGRKPGYGRMVVLEHNTCRTGYAHLADIMVTKGQEVQQGELVGRVGASGRATGPHLHFEYRTLDDEPLDPLLFLPQEHLFSSQ